MAVALAPSAYASDAGPGTFVFEFGSLGHGPGEFDRPSVGAVGPDGKIAVWSYNAAGRHSLHIFHPNGTFDFQLVDSQRWRFTAFGPDGKIYTGMYDGVMGYHPNGTWALAFDGDGGEDRYANFDFDVGPDGKIFVTRTYHVNVFHPNGTLAFKIGSFGDGAGEFRSMASVSVGPDGKVYVDGDGRIQVLHPNGTYAYELAYPDRSWQSLMDVGPNGEMVDGKCHVAHPNGTSAFQLRLNAGDVHSCKFGPDGMVFATRGDRVLVFNGIEVAGGWKPSLLFERSSEGSSGRRSYTPAPELSFTGGTFAFEFGSLGSGPGHLMAPRNVAFGPGGFMAVSDTGNHRVQVFNPDGTFAFALGLRGEGPGEFYWPEGLAFGPGGLLAVADMGNNRVQVFRLQ